MPAVVPSKAVAPAAEDKPSFKTALKLPSVSILAASRAASKLATAIVSYGAMVYLAIQGATQLQISLVSASSYAAALAFGIQGGSLSDSMSKRIALVAGYVAQALLCFLVPVFWGTDVGALMFIMFAASALNQVISPSIKSAVALVSTPGQLATVSATVTMAGSIASAIGSSFMAPLLIKYSGMKTILIVAGFVYLIGALRTLKLPASEKTMAMTDALRSVEWKPQALSLRWTAGWIVDHRPVATMILSGAIVVALFEAFNTLIPIYIRDVLKANPANAVYIFAPAGVGFAIATFATPRLISWIGERKLAVLSLLMLTTSTFLFGTIEAVAPYLAPFSPLRAAEWLGGIELNDRVLAASLIAVPANFGSTAAGATVQVYINRRVPIVQQGATFGLQEVVENGLTLVAVVVLGVVANVVGAQYVFLFAPIVLFAVVTWLIRYGYKRSGQEDVSALDALGMLGDESGDAYDPQPAKPATKKSAKTSAPKTPPAKKNAGKKE
ncbi:MAG: MFS transporter [Thermomicrobiales bacterium]|nr:MFS transporter [Thermomicrobiales bacterium]